MVLLKTTLAGACLLVVGILLLTTLGQYVTVEVRQVQQRDVEPHAEFLVGDVADRNYTLPANVAASGSVDVTQAPTNTSGDIMFWVFDADNYQKWNSGQQSDFMFSAEKQGQFNFTFTTGNAGVYHFVFDNRAVQDVLFKKYIVLSVGYSEVTISHVPDPRVPYIGWALAVVGGIVLVIGLAKKPPIPWA
ncbi:MAG: hypothetical protein ABSE39_01900 [Candidatus Bathyarchaeia archaeon]|jgi:hypothetical protein